MLDPRMALNICIASAGSIWTLLIVGGAWGLFMPIGYALLAITVTSTMMLYWRYRGLFW